MKTAHGFFSFLFLLFFTASATTQTAVSTAHTPSVFEALTATEGVSLVLETDLVTLKEDRKSEQWIPGALRTADGNLYQVNVKSRGVFRRSKSEMPPLKIKFSKKGLRTIGLDTMNEIKLVTPFTLDKKGDELVIREYLAYRMWEQLTPYSFRARLVQLTLKDSHLGTQQQMYCIMLEDKEELLARLNGTMVETYGLEQDQLEGRQLALASLFQYMIGNTDWAVNTFHNVKLMQVPSKTGLVVVPFDFDFSGLVNAPYAVPSTESGNDNVRQRFFMVNGLAEADLTAATKTLLAARADLTALCNSPHLSRRAVTDLTRYLDSFYEKIPACSDVQCIADKTQASTSSLFRD